MCTYVATFNGLRLSSRVGILSMRFHASGKKTDLFCSVEKCVGVVQGSSGCGPNGAGGLGDLPPVPPLLSSLSRRLCRWIERRTAYPTGPPRSGGLGEQYLNR